jgi:hypothetical protein
MAVICLTPVWETLTSNLDLGLAILIGMKFNISRTVKVLIVGIDCSLVGCYKHFRQMYCFHLCT